MQLLESVITQLAANQMVEIPLLVHFIDSRVLFTFKSLHLFRVFQGSFHQMNNSSSCSLGWDLLQQSTSKIGSRGVW